MKKITALLLCFLLLCTCCVTASAAQMGDAPVSAVISATVPDTHTITVSAEHAKVFYEGVTGEVFTVGRLSTPRLLFRAESGWEIESVVINGIDVSKDIYGGYLDLEPVYEDKTITVTTDVEPAASRNTYTVKGKVTLNGQPLTNVDLELRSTLKKDTTDKNGRFSFTEGENCGIVTQHEFSCTFVRRPRFGVTAHPTGWGFTRPLRSTRGKINERWKQP